MFKKVIHPAQYVAVSQTILGISIAICFLIIPHYFFSLDQGGVSNYGTDDRTIVFFTAGFAAAAIGMLLAAIRISPNVIWYRRLRFILYMLSLFYALVLVSTFPYKLDSSYQSIHLIAAFALALIMLIVSVWLRFFAVADSIVKLGFLLYGLGFMIGLLTLFNTLHLLFTVQIISGLGFSISITRSVRLMTR